MFAPFYLIFIPVALILIGFLWVLYLRVTKDPDSDLRRRNRSDLEIAQEMERKEKTLHDEDQEKESRVHQ